MEEPDPFSKIASDARQLLGDALKQLRATDERAKAAGSPWWKRHRLCVSLEAVDHLVGRLEVQPLPLVFAAELSSTIARLRELRDDPMWPAIVRLIVNEYPHTVAQLHFSQYLRSQGLRPTLVPTGLQTTPDLKFDVPGGAYPLYVEMYQPAVLAGRQIHLDARGGRKIANKAVAKAMAQLGRARIGIVAVAGFNLTEAGYRTLQASARSLTTSVKMPSFAGIAVLRLGAEIRQHDGPLTIQPKIQVTLVPNDLYFAAIQIRGDGDRPRTFAADRPALHLTPVNRSDKVHLPIVRGHGNRVPPFFLGSGPTDYKCSRCDVLIAQGVWPHAIDGLVVECPACGGLSLFSSPSPPLAPTLRITTGGVNVSGPILIRSNVAISGAPVAAQQRDGSAR